ncbi:MAG: IS4 family transposase [Actinobacteria bacterium]|nr:IS4 family transposase [Actinomycetota bacterium]MCG2819517.1 IS4 family transposase [Actinomycetes bacterium]MBU4178382.1 IS4 family transposase [Actinomycetota bacterium]MBU4218490.1 IS4 family transposase [Actinomycetota bacterium]MBU4360141.1 IS4 family transposase [Actinomycetota bacterium]
MYRFVGNGDVPISRLREARAKVVLDRVPRDSEFLIVHDVTLLDYSKHYSKDDRRVIGDTHGKGYEYVSCLAVDPESATLLGVVHDTVVSEDGPDDQDSMEYDYEPMFEEFTPEEKRRLRDNHRHQMAVHVNGLSETLSGYHMVHVGDREFDDILVMENCLQSRSDFVVRTVGNRNVQVPRYDWVPPDAITTKRPGHRPPEGYVCVNLPLLLEHVPLESYKTLSLNSRGRVTDERSAERHASLSIGSFKARLHRDVLRNRKRFSTCAPVDVSVVVIRETNPPQDEDPLQWILFTSLPVDTPEQMAKVGRAYELRWSIEQFFRLLKSGFGIEKARYDNAEKIAKLLVLLTLAAMLILNLKRDIGLPSKGALTDEEYQRIKTAMLEPESEDIDLDTRLFAFIAKYDGWIGRRGDPIGPTVLMRGLLQVLAILDAYERFGPLIKEAVENPNILKRLFCV